MMMPLVKYRRLVCHYEKAFSFKKTYKIIDVHLLCDSVKACVKVKCETKLRKLCLPQTTGAIALEYIAKALSLHPIV